MDGHALADGGRYGHSLRPAELQHRLHVLAEEGRLDGQFVGMVGVDDTRHTLVDAAKADVGIALAAHIDHTHDDQFRLVAPDVEQAVAHHVRARIDAKDGFLSHQRSI